MRVDSAIEQELGGEAELPQILRRFFFRFKTTIGWGVAVVLLVLTVAPLSVSRRHGTQSSAARSPAVDSPTRPCKNIATSPKHSKGTKKKNLGDTNTDPAACLEVRSTALDVQEFLQAYGREQKWNLIDESVGEDGWTFSRKLEKDELLRFTKTDTNSSAVDWTSGMGFVQIKTVKLDDGYVRVQISARFQGYGQSPDRFAPPKDTWPLTSNASLENQLVSVLETHFKNAS